MVDHVRVTQPWLCNMDCPLFGDGDYVSCSALAKMMGCSYNFLVKQWEKNVVRTLDGARQYRNFVRIDALNELIVSLAREHENLDARWRAEETVHDAVAQMMPSPPPRKRPSREESVSSVESSSAPVANAPLEDAPVWVPHFLQQVRECVGTDAVRAYMLTDEFTEHCRAALKKRVANLEQQLKQEMRSRVEEQLRRELTPKVEESLRVEFQKEALERYQLSGARNVIDSTTKATSDKEILREFMDK